MTACNSYTLSVIASFKYTEFNYKSQKRPHKQCQLFTRICPIKFYKIPSSKNPSYTLCNMLIYLLAIKILRNSKANVSNHQL